MKIDLIAGTRPNVMKIAPVYIALRSLKWCQPRLVFIKQHDHRHMSHDLLGEFGIVDFTVLNISTENFGDRLGSIVSEYSKLIAESTPDAVLVPGDVDVAVGGALAAKRAGLPVIHLEAGLRSHDRRMPEEINRIIIDSISDLLLAPSEAATQNLIFHEGHPHASVEFVGNVMIDSLTRVVSDAAIERVTTAHELRGGEYAIATFHRPSNVDHPENLERIINALKKLAKRIPVIFPVHPRTRANLVKTGLIDKLEGQAIKLLEPVGYTDFVNLMAGSAVMVTDSGGIQEETSYLGVPCLTLRDTTERPITLTLGTNHLVDFDTLEPVISSITLGRRAVAQSIPLWDGLAAWRVAHSIKSWSHGIRDRSARADRRGSTQ
ncbi:MULTISPECIES: non-hydrolyzing UDP-N-acetylglucosamine 2-epimerase [Brevundimonas]|uniref:UDP-N-acetylglucosamine 2-epimerase n=1 Tax=Brevundimonas abyssalis TAR-001 TaxID=1391729 RepID=A0A8E0TRQ2_9CAUL|nr:MULTISPECIES: UDP-N-acetylglucosamine 2-epimerase (non-hydrolyzing) [Brevundimonas]GAD59918.1 UDP-N-acetylglucosamine 2-epimerase [Brevundimonas abyssalis TAR-001]